jgi:hypothetical protein
MPITGYSNIISVTTLGLLDAYPNAAAAYSLRKLRTAYTGSAIKVRRTNLDEMDIGFTSTGELDTAALLAFTGTGALDNGFVTTWYDQSGNGRNATQTNALNQPQIVSGGTILTQTGLGSSRPILRFDGTNDSFNFSTITAPQFTTFYPSKKAVNLDLSAWFANSIGIDAPYTPIIFGGAGIYIGNNIRSSSNSSYNNNNYILMSGYINSVNNGFIQINNSSIPLPSPPFLDTGTNNFNTICARGGIQFSKCDVPEMIFYNFDNSANISAINTNINTYYGIY